MDRSIKPPGVFVALCRVFAVREEGSKKYIRSDHTGKLSNEMPLKGFH